MTAKSKLAKVARSELDRVTRLGRSKERFGADALLDLARIVADEPDRFENLSSADDQTVMTGLMQLKGIGR